MFKIFMSNSLKSFVLFAVIGFGISGCMSVKSFVDPIYPKISYDQITRLQSPLRLNLVVEFQRNGEHLPNVDQILRDNAERILRASGVIVPASDEGEDQIKVVVNNIADSSIATAKGFGTGLTLGLVGSTVVDAYEMSVVITVNGKTVERAAIKHALHSAIGNTATPEGLETMPPNMAFERVLEQMLLRVLHDIQKEGELDIQEKLSGYHLPEFADVYQLSRADLSLQGMRYVPWHSAAIHADSNALHDLAAFA
jgi:hypothetical protein